ncbi:N-acetylmuramidase family protein [Chitinivorax sp. B]|uniref:N-acetylmuramidase domain-containing protein n=1 Tax=Chitinivorax sp. B TaxID=2502235 RepID=UPI0010F6942D|nr:N-acetylmuramidase family protein [Chitinivorax sp. B]
MDLMLRIGDVGQAVADLQRQLNEHGAQLAIDGWFGEATRDAVKQLQAQAGLVVDGMAGLKTREALTGQPNPKRLREADLIAAAAQLGVSLAAIKAVNQVESRGSGFLPDGRPVILVERHIAYRQAEAAGLDVQALQQRYPTLINPMRGGYVGRSAEWVRFEGIQQIANEQVAIEACSWGLFQIMGYHWQRLGYDSAQAFRTAMEASEAAQLDAFIRFLQADAVLLKALKARRWAEFAKLYNGPAYKANLYDVKLAQAFAEAEGTSDVQ